MERKRPEAPLFAKLILFLTIGLLFAPLVFMFVMSLLQKDFDNNWSLTLRWYLEVFQDQQMQQALSRSLLIATTSSFISVCLGTLGALSILRTDFQFKKQLSALSMTSLVLPELVFALSLLSWFFVTKIPLGFFTVICSHVVFTLSFVLMILKTRIEGLDRSVEEAAQDLGASSWMVVARVILPQMKPALVSGFVLSFLLSFDDFLITFFTSGVGSDTLPIKLYTSMKMGLTPKLTALSCLMMLGTGCLSVLLVRSKSFRDV